MTNKNKKVKILLYCVIVLIGVLLMVVGVVLSVKKENQTPNDNIPSESEEAESILTKLKIKEYLELSFYPFMQQNVNILDATTENLYIYSASNDDISKYAIQEIGGSESKFLYAKYNDFTEWYELMYGEALNSQMIETRMMAFNKLSKLDSDTYEYDFNDLEKCNESNIDNCYIMLVDSASPTGSVAFSDLKINNNIISGKLHYQQENENYYTVASFEFVYKEKDDKYYVESLKITDIN